MHDDDYDNGAGDGNRPENERVQRPNKEQLKRETQALRELVVQLLELSPSQLDSVSLAADVREQFNKARKMERGALQRQIRYIVGLLRDVDSDVLGRELQQLGQADRRQVREFHETEQWRDALLDGRQSDR